MAEKKRPPLQRLMNALLSGMEDDYPSLSRLMRYHSRVINPFHLNDVTLFDRPLKWLDEPYLDHFRRLDLSTTSPDPDAPKSYLIPVSVLETDDYIIHGNIKAPIQESTGLALSYLPISRLSLTDSYPLPIYRSVRVEGHIIFIPNIENYFHLMVDYLLPPISAIVRNPNGYRCVTLVMQRDFPMANVIAKSLNDLGLETSVLRLSRFDRVTGGRLVMGGAAPQDSGAAFVYSDEVRTLAQILDHHIQDMNTPRRVFVTRAGATRRRILNESELRTLFKKHDISIVELGFQNPLEQIALFRNAELIVSVHGASLTNLIWSKHTRVVELFPANLRPKHYLNIAAQIGLDYQLVLGSDGNEREDFTVDVMDVEQVLCG
jgi:Glycosyltransferase 61